MENQEWGRFRNFPGNIVKDEEEEGALRTAKRRKDRRKTIWADGSRLDNGKVGAVAVWRRRPTSRRLDRTTHGGHLPPGTQADWTGRRFHLGDNKEVFDAGAYAIYQALRVFDARSESSTACTVFFRFDRSA